MKPRVDTARLNRDASILAMLPSGTKVHRVSDHHWRAQCPLHGGDGLSLGIWYGRWGWSYTCFACNEKGQAIDFAMAIHGLTFKGAVESLGAGTLDAPPPVAWKPIKKAYVLPCIARGCGEWLEVDVTDLPWLGEGLHNAWTFKHMPDGDVMARCPVHTRRAAFGRPGAPITPTLDRLLFHVLTSAQRDQPRRRAA